MSGVQCKGVMGRKWVQSALYKGLKTSLEQYQVVFLGLECENLTMKAWGTKDSYDNLAEGNKYILR